MYHSVNQLKSKLFTVKTAYFKEKLVVQQVQWLYKLYGLGLCLRSHISRL